MKKDIDTLKKLESEATPSRRLRPIKPPMPPAVPSFKKPARLSIPEALAGQPSAARGKPLPVSPPPLRIPTPVSEVQNLRESVPIATIPVQPQPIIQRPTPVYPERAKRIEAVPPARIERPTPPPIRPRDVTPSMQAETPAPKPSPIRSEEVAPPSPPPTRPTVFAAPPTPPPIRPREVVPPTRYAPPVAPISEAIPIVGEQITQPRERELERPQEISMEERPLVPKAPSAPERPAGMPSVEPMAARPAIFPRRPVMPPAAAPKEYSPGYRFSDKEPAEKNLVFAEIIGIIIGIVFLLGIISFTYWLFFVKSRPEPSVCVQVITPAQNPKTGECKEFPNPCVVPGDWKKVAKCEVEKLTIPSPTTPPSSSGGTLITPTAPPVISEPTPPQSLIPEANIAETKTIEITNKDDLASALAKAIEEKYTPGKFTRLLVKYTQSDKKEYINLSQFLDFMGINAPEGVLSKLDQDYTLFVRPQQEGNRLGLAVKIKTKSGLWDVMKTWEPKMISDWDPLFRIWVVYKRAPKYSPKEVTWQGVPLRYIAYMSGLGINYAISGDYLFFTTSGDSIHALIESIK